MFNATGPDRTAAGGMNDTALSSKTFVALLIIEQQCTRWLRRRVSAAGGLGVLVQRQYSSSAAEKADKELRFGEGSDGELRAGATGLQKVSKKADDVPRFCLHVTMDVS